MFIYLFHLVFAASCSQTLVWTRSKLNLMKTMIPLEFYISDLAAIGFFMFAPAILFLIVAIILGALKKKKESRVLLIISGCCFLVAIGACGFGS